MIHQKEISKERGMKSAIIAAALIGGICTIIAAIITVSGMFGGREPFEDTKILVLNSCSRKHAETTLHDIIKRKYKKAVVETQPDWDFRYEMPQTRIYYITPSFKEEAFILEKWFPGPQEVIDYLAQKGMYGLEKRNLVIFLGNDYLDVLRAN